MNYTPLNPNLLVLQEGFLFGIPRASNQQLPYQPVNYSHAPVGKKGVNLCFPNPSIYTINDSLFRGCKHQDFYGTNYG